MKKTVLIVEDEIPAASRLEKMVMQANDEYNIVAKLESIADTVLWLKQNEAPDLILMDIQIADGLCFDIFKKADVTSPVIFTTAYDEYALEAFKVNSIDYLLKPIKKEELHRALQKFEKLNFKVPAADYINIGEKVAKKQHSKLLRIIVRYADVIKAIDLNEVAYFYTENKINFVCTKTNERYGIDYNLEEMEHLVDEVKFFRINRQFIININAIAKMFNYSKSRIKMVLNPPSEIETIVSTERAADFKKWLTGSAE